MVGNVALLDLPEKVGFLASRRVSPEAVQKCREWAIAAGSEGRCVISGFQSQLEKEVLEQLLLGTAPVILVLARRLWKTVPAEMRDAVGNGRLLVISPTSAERVSEASAAARNRWILENCDTLVLGSLDPNGGLAKLIALYPKERIKLVDG